MIEQDPFFRTRRRTAVSRHPTQIGIDYVAVEQGQAEQSLQLVLCFIPPAEGAAKNPLPSVELNPSNCRILGGAASIRVVGSIEAVVRAGQPALVVPLQYDPDAASGLFPTYTLELVDVPHLDPFFARVDFSLQVDEPAQFDPRRVPPEPAEILPTPEIDYLARDFQSFRQLMLDRLSILMPQWTEPSVADIGHVLVEILAHAADKLSYYQDAVATEAYLGTARRRVSMRRHARLLDYAMHEGCNARVWVQVQVNAGENINLPIGTKLLTGVTGLTATVLSAAAYEQALLKGARVFESMHPLELAAAHNEIPFYTWGARDFTLAEGTTQATLRGHFSYLTAGQVLIFEELPPRDDQTLFGESETARPEGRPVHVVRLTGVVQRKDPLGEQLEPTPPANGSSTGATPITEITWHGEDALPFPLPIASHRQTEPLSVARGNIVLADHGRTIIDEDLQPAAAPVTGRYRPHLRYAPLTHAVPYDHDLARSQSAALTTRQDPRQVRPAINLLSETQRTQAATWQARRDLLDSDRFTTAFVIEVDNDERASLRFGDGSRGQKPQAGTRFRATYRTGNGVAGNVGRRAVAHVALLDSDPAGLLASRISHVCNYLAAQGGTAPESLEQVRLYAPRASHTQERCVVEADYAAVAERHPEVLQAAAILRWTGSWYIAVIVVNRRHGRPVDSAFQAELQAFMEPYRLGGYDLAIRGPRFVPLDIVLTVQVAATHFASTVKQTLLETFSAVDLANGQRGFFHPDNFGLGQPVYLSQLIARAVQVPGVAWVETTRFQCWGRPSRAELENGQIPIGPLEIARLYNDASTPQNGRLEFNLAGGR